MILQAFACRISGFGFLAVGIVIPNLDSCSASLLRTMFDIPLPQLLHYAHKTATVFHSAFLDDTFHG